MDVIEWNLGEALDYVKFNAVDNEDYLECDADTQTKYLNVAHRTLTRKYKGLVIPNSAVYLFAAVLGYSFNDTNKMQQQGVASSSVKGISITFKDWAKKGLDALIPDEVLDLINDENGTNLTTGAVTKWVTL